MAVISRSLTLYGDFELGLVVKGGARDFVVSARKVIDPKKEIKTGLLWFTVQLTGREAFLESATSWSSGKAFSYNVRASPQKWFPAHVNEISQLTSCNTASSLEIDKKTRLDRIAHPTSGEDMVLCCNLMAGSSELRIALWYIAQRSSPCGYVIWSHWCYGSNCKA
jgi:hypothetical protein